MPGQGQGLAQYTTAHLIASQFPRHGFMDDLITERSFDSQAPRSLMCLAYFFDTLSLGICTNRHWQASSRLMQEINVCTVDSGSSMNDLEIWNFWHELCHFCIVNSLNKSSFRKPYVTPNVKINVSYCKLASYSSQFSIFMAYRQNTNTFFYGLSVS